jgi:hypothetical protein
MQFYELFEKYGVLAYGVAIIFGGLYGVKFFSLFKTKKHNFLAFASAFALIFVIIEVALNTFDKMDAPKYLITYAICTSVYELFLKKWIGDKDDELPKTN